MTSRMRNFLIGLLWPAALAAVSLAAAPLAAAPLAAAPEAAAENATENAGESAAGNSTEPAGAEVTVTELVAALDSDIYEARRRATEELVIAGRAAIDPVVAAVQQGSLETISRGIFVLRQMALNSQDPDTGTAAYRALRQIADARFTTASRHAGSALHAVHESRHQLAHRFLSERGAVISVTQVPVAMAMQQGFPSISFGDGWRGTLDDLQRLEWITSYRPDENTPPWMIVLEGDKITDSWMDAIGSLENVSVIKFKSAGITDEAIRKLTTMRDLQILEVLYTPVTDGAIDHLLAMPKLERMRLYGNQFSEDGWLRLRQQAATFEVDLRRGGFLGIGCDDNPCRVTIVRPGSVAATAGFQAGDVVLSYNQQPVQTMEELTRLIGQNVAGDKVTMELLRDGEKLTKEVVLGKWD
jgi:hypothetical protein